MVQNSLTANWLATPRGEEGASADTRTRSLVVALHWILRIGVAGCFIGHGMFGVLVLTGLVKESWVNYFAVVGIGRTTAVSLMPLVGFFDVALGILTLFVPIRAVMAWLVFWGVWTALLRPLAGENPYEFIERAGNYGVPFVLLYLSGFGTSIRSWFFEVARPALTVQKAQAMGWMLRGIVALCLIGHGLFGVVVAKPVWFKYLGGFGLSKETITANNLFGVIGWVEIAVGVAVLFLPFRRVVALRYLLPAIAVVKIVFEMLRFSAGEPYGWFEVIERMGTYTAPLALFVLYFWLDRVQGRETVPAQREESPRIA